MMASMVNTAVKADLPPFFFFEGGASLLGVVASFPLSVKVSSFRSYSASGMKLVGPIPVPAKYYS
jgi:hypothetical protein